MGSLRHVPSLAMPYNPTIQNIGEMPVAVFLCGITSPTFSFWFCLNEKTEIHVWLSLQITLLPPKIMRY